MKKITYLIVVITLASCHFFKKKNEESLLSQSTSTPVAKAYDSYLYEKDIEGLLVGEYSVQDSIDFVKRYINSWVKKQVFLKKSEKNIESSLNEIEKKVEDYRYDLMVYEYQKKYIREELNNTVTDNEVAKFYEDNKSNFELKQNIVRCQFARIPLTSPKLQKVIKWFKSKKQKDFNKFKEFTLQYSDSYSFDDNIWYDFNDIINNTPFASYQNQVKFLKNKKNNQESDSNYVYLLKILEYKISDEISPLEFVKDRIKDVIINKRKVELIKKLEEGIYKQAEKNKDFEIFN